MLLSDLVMCFYVFAWDRSFASPRPAPPRRRIEGIYILHNNIMVQSRFVNTLVSVDAFASPPCDERGGVRR